MASSTIGEMQLLSPLVERFVSEITKPARGGYIEMTMDDSTSAQFTTDQLIADIVANLRNDDHRDAEVLDILSDNIVKLTPSKDAVDAAVKALEALAEKRAKEPGDDAADHN